MLTYVQGNLLESPAQVLVNPVNTEGVMGKGLAKDFKRIYPDMFKQYQRYCENGQLTVGKLWLYKTPHKWVLNFPTKTTWRKPSQLSYIEQGLQAFANAYVRKGINSIAFPQLGCGNGELNWDHQVRPLMERILKNLPIEVYIHLYAKGRVLPEHRSLAEIEKWLHREPCTLAFAEWWRDLTDLVTRKREWQALGTKQPFTAEIAGNVLRLKAGEREKTLAQEEVGTLWDVLRGYGILTVGQIPNGMQVWANELLALLAELPYCHLTHAAAEYKAIGDMTAYGVQLISMTVDTVQEAEVFTLKAANQ